MDHLMQQAAQAAADAQAAQARRTLAYFVAEYYHALVEAGMPEGGAIQLARDWQARLLTPATPPSGAAQS